MSHLKSNLKTVLPGAILTGLLGIASIAQATNPKPTPTISEADRAKVMDVVFEMLGSEHGLPIDHLASSAIPGFYDVVTGGQYFLVSQTGRFLIRGSAFDREQHIDLSETALPTVRARLLEKVPEKDRITFAPDEVKHKVVVLTDISCGYCQRLHSQMAEYNARGIAVEYMAFPRMGVESETGAEMESIWCADDRKAALTAVMNGESIEKRSCKNPIASHHGLGQRLGLQGTPLIITETGEAIHGYLPPEMLEQRLGGRSM